jgi:hypothetical protein
VQLMDAVTPTVLMSTVALVDPGAPVVTTATTPVFRKGSRPGQAIVQVQAQGPLPQIDLEPSSVMFWPPWTE